MSTNLYWEKIPVTVVSFKASKDEECLGIWRIEATLRTRPYLGNREITEFSINWVYGPSLILSHNFYSNKHPYFFHWAYENITEGMEVFYHHNRDTDEKYLYTE